MACGFESTDSRRESVRDSPGYGPLRNGHQLELGEAELRAERADLDHQHLGRELQPTRDAGQQRDGDRGVTGQAPDTVE
ncbi:MAG: hypothetical protein ABGY29_02300 [bacterium]